jgi:lipid A 3-O-deacylase
MKFVYLVAVLLIPILWGQAAENKKTAVPADVAATSAAERAMLDDAWTVMLGAGYLPDQQFNASSARSYAVVPLQVSLLWNLDEVGNDDVAWGWFRGNTSFRFSSFYQVITHGSENRFVGLLAGPQYNFVQPGWNLVPFIGAQVGMAFTDSNNDLYSQGQDFCFTFSVNPGVRYFFNEKWSVIGELVYQHYSNGGLSEPGKQNTGLDLFGPQFSVAYGF